MKFRYFIFFFLFSLVVIFPFITTSTVINGNDLNGNIVPLLYFKESILTYHSFPLWNPYIHQGIPTVADPLYGIYNPIIGIPILLFNYQVAIKLSYLLSVFLSCITMFTLLKLFKIRDILSLITSITYASSSYLYSRIVAGHIEKVVSFGFLPLFIFCLIKVIQTKQVLWAGLTAITITLILFTGDIYNAMYCLYSLFAIILYSLFKKRQVLPFLLLTFILFLLFSSIKIVPMIELQGYISKIKEPFNGGLTFLTFTSNLFFPFEGLLSKIFRLSDLSTGYGWWESLSFIGPFSILGIYFLLKSVLKKNYKKELSILIVLSILYLMLASPGSSLNPYHYLITTFPLLQYFHVPSRILALWSVIILTGFCMFLDTWKRRKLAIAVLCLNFFIVFIFSEKILSVKDFYVNLSGYDKAFSWIKNNNQNNYYMVHGESQSKIPQDKAFLNHLLMLQSNYGLFLKNSLAEKYNFKGSSTYNDLNPGFVVATKGIDDSDLEEVKRIDGKIIYKNLYALPFATIGSEPQYVAFQPNKIVIEANTEESKLLNLLESNYPGWEVYVDGVKTKLFPGRFLETFTLKGKHKYEFIFTSKDFLYGLLVSCSSFFLWGLYIIYNYDIIRKIRFKKS